MSARTAVRLCLVAALTLLPAALLAGGTRTWEQSRFEEFQKGTTKGVAIRSDGALELAPAFRTLTTTPSTYIWAAVADPDGNVYAAAGSPARVYRVTPAGQTTVIFEPQELQVQSLALAPDGTLYAATSPDGKVYKITRQPGATAPAASSAKEEQTEAPAADQTPRTVARDESYTSSVFFDPKTKYIWNLALDNEGRLYVATGDAGQIFRVTPGGQSSVFFKSDEAHIRVLAFDRGGNLIAGSDGSGLIYRISPAGEGFVLYSAPKKEITALVLDDAGNIYAAGAGEKRGAMGSLTPSAFSLGVTAMTQAQPQPPTQGGIQVQTTTPQPQPSLPPMPTLGMGATGSEIYMISPDGAPRRIWQSREDLVYALAFDHRQRLLAGTGNRGLIYAIDPRGGFTNLVKASATQVIAFASAGRRGLYAVSSNLGKVFALEAGTNSAGSFDSDVFDAQNFSQWGRFEARASGKYELFTRSGNVDNPDRHWSEWKPVEPGGAVASPAARFLQWRVVLHPGNEPASLRMARIHYLPKNVAPVIDDVVAAAGVRFQPVPRMQAGESATLNVGSAGQQQSQPQQQRFEMVPPASRDRNSISARWAARDENDDDLEYSLYYRGDGETTWKLLAEDITDKYYTWEAGLFPDGGYTLKLVASDAPSNPPDAALTDERESQRFEVDNTPPVISNLSATLAPEGIRVSFRAADSFSAVSRAEYSLNAGEWRTVRPVGEVSDSLREEYSFVIPIPATPAQPPAAAAAAPPQKPARRGRAAQPAPAAAAPPASAPEAQEYVIVLRVYDRFDNLGTAKAVVKP